MWPYTRKQLWDQLNIHFIIYSQESQKHKDSFVRRPVELLFMHRYVIKLKADSHYLMLPLLS